MLVGAWRLSVRRVVKQGGLCGGDKFGCKGPRDPRRDFDHGCASRHCRVRGDFEALAMVQSPSEPRLLVAPARAAASLSFASGRTIRSGMPALAAPRSSGPHRQNICRARQSIVPCGSRRGLDPPVQHCGARDGGRPGMALSVVASSGSAWSGWRFPAFLSAADRRPSLREPRGPMPCQAARRGTCFASPLQLACRDWSPTPRSTKGSWTRPVCRPGSLPQFGRSEGYP